MVISEYLSLSETAELVGKCKETLRRWDEEGSLNAVPEPVSNYRVYMKQNTLNQRQEVFGFVPPKAYWRNLPLDIQKEYIGGGKTGMARRIGWDKPSLTLTCSPAEKQSERCHPDETRPFTVHEYARIQSFPDEWDLVLLPNSTNKLEMLCLLS